MTEEKIGLILEVNDDGVGEGLAETGRQAEKASEQVDGLKLKIDDSSIQMDKLNRTIKAADIANSITVIQGLSSATGQAISSMRTLGLISDDTAEALSKVQAGIQLITAAGTAIKSLSGLVSVLNAQEAVHNALLTFKKVLSNPVNLAIIGIAGTAAAGVAGAAYMGYRYTQNKNVSNSTTTNITIQDTSVQKETASEIYSILGGGAL